MALLLLATAGSAHAEWRIIYAEPEYFVEFDSSAVREHGTFRLAWTRVTFTEAKREGNDFYQSQGQLHAIDCPQQASTVVGTVNYSGAFGQGTQVGRKTRPRAEWQAKAAPPDSLAAMIIATGCRATTP
ncbi:MAG TPA: surface-adhesin E family protein [Burkholderiales bacterium]|nr:surface-adhesin E family protein [Burkholderiales bacterium]